MRFPSVRGLMDRRILVNYRVDPEVLARLVPAPFHPLVVHGHGMAGICLIRLRHIRPWFVPGVLGIGSENAAHRIAVVWEQYGEPRQGVFVPRRDTSSWLNVLAGGRVFPGTHHRAKFDVAEYDGFHRIGMQSRDGQTRLRLEAREAVALPPGSIFGSLAEASAFFEQGSVGYSIAHQPGQLDGLELRCRRWDVKPLEVEQVQSSFFDDERLFPKGSAAFDCALVMRGIEHEWHGRESIHSVPVNGCCAGRDAMSAAIEQVALELSSVLKRADGINPDRVRELQASWTERARHISQMDVQLARARSTRETEHLRRDRQRTYDDLMALLAWVRELVSMLRLAQQSGAPPSRTEELLAQIAAAVREGTGISQVSAQ